MIKKSVLEIIEQEISDIKPFKPERIILCSTPVTCTIASEAFKGLSGITFLMTPASPAIDDDAIQRSFDYADVRYIAHEEALLWTNAGQGLFKPVSELLDSWIMKSEKVFYALTSLENSFEEAVLHQALSYVKQTRGELMRVLIVLLPSRVESISSFFNAYTWLLTVLGEKLADIVVLFEKEYVDGYEAISLLGEPLKGLRAIGYALKLIAERDSDLMGYFKSTTEFDVKAHISLLSLGHNLSTYGNIQNVFKASTLRPLASYNTLRAKTIYTIPEIPVNLKSELSTKELQNELSKWIKKIGISPVFWGVSEPIIRNVKTGRISLVSILGGIDLKTILSHIEKGYTEFRKIASGKEMINQKSLNHIQRFEKELSI